MQKIFCLLFYINNLNSMQLEKTSYFKIASEIENNFDSKFKRDKYLAFNYMNNYIIEKIESPNDTLQIYEILIKDFSRADIVIINFLYDYKVNFQLSDLFYKLSDKSKIIIFTDLIKIILDLNKKFLDINSNDKEQIPLILFQIINKYSDINFYIYLNAKLSKIKECLNNKIDQSKNKYILIAKDIIFQINSLIDIHLQEIENLDSLNNLNLYKNISKNLSLDSKDILDNFNQNQIEKAITIFNSFDKDYQDKILDDLFEYYFQNNPEIYLYSKEKIKHKTKKNYIPAIYYLKKLFLKDKNKLFNKILILYKRFSIRYSNSLKTLNNLTEIQNKLIKEKIFIEKDIISYYKAPAKIRLIYILKDYIDSKIDYSNSEIINIALKN